MSLKCLRVPNSQVKSQFHASNRKQIQLQADKNKSFFLKQGDN